MEWDKFLISMIFESARILWVKSSFPIFFANKTRLSIGLDAERASIIERTTLMIITAAKMPMAK